jgi:long-subunit acyl-CoA synthetase (AMP-forming)
VYAALLEGATCIVPPLAQVGLTGSSHLDAAVCLAAIERAQANSVILLPQMLRMLLSAITDSSEVTKSLRFVAVGGGRVAPALLAQAQALGVPAFEGYGLSECASVVALNRPGAQRRGSVGRLLPHVRVRVSEEGEIEVAGNNQLGYLGGASAIPGEWLATGDLGHLDDAGFLHIYGRRKNVIITAFGRNVSPEWPEAELLAGPAIAQAAVFGEARAQLCAVVVPLGTTVPDAGVQAEVDAGNRRLPDYARIGVWVRADAAFSVGNGQATANGRVQRAAVLAQYAAQLDGAGSDAVL